MRVREELCEELKNIGVETTQATLSRDLNEMGIIRLPTENGFKYSFSKNELGNTLKNIVGLEMISLLHNENCVIVKTLPGRAQGVAVYFDELENSHIIGTVAGDDTILLIPDSVNNVGKLADLIKRVMEGSKNN